MSSNNSIVIHHSLPCAALKRYPTLLRRYLVLNFQAGILFPLFICTSSPTNTRFFILFHFIYWG
uniref:Uncharacterized protein n=1 Tax=Rhizophora mucronata TaxID=61149 RepID=A0A2P2Q865_RHIMU